MDVDAAGVVGAVPAGQRLDAWSESDVFVRQRTSPAAIQLKRVAWGQVSEKEIDSRGDAMLRRAAGWRGLGPIAICVALGEENDPTQASEIRSTA